jgi:hypothetical protein
MAAAQQRRRNGGGTGSGSGGGGGGVRVGGGSSGPPEKIDGAQLFAQASQRHIEFNDRIGPASVAAVNFAVRIAESEAFTGDKVATVRPTFLRRLGIWTFQSAYVC